MEGGRFWCVFLLVVATSAAPSPEPEVYDGTVEFRAARRFLASGQPEKAAELLEELIKKAPFVEVDLHSRALSFRHISVGSSRFHK